MVDRTFKTNQQWVAQTPITNRDGPPKWSWFGVLFNLAPFDLLSGRTEYPTVRVCACTEGYRKVYEKKTGWIVIMDHLTFVHGIAKDTKHPSVLRKKSKETRVEWKERAHDADMSEVRFQTICITWYIIRRLLPPYVSSAPGMENNQGRDTTQPRGIKKTLSTVI